MADAKLLGQDNHVWLNDQGLIEVQVVGQQSADTVVAMGALIADLARQQRTNDQPVLVLDDLRRMALKQPTEVPKTVAAVARRIDFDKVAMLGSSSGLIKYSSNFIIQAIGKIETIKYFGDRAEAERWLKR